MNKKILCNFWIPNEAKQFAGEGFDFILPKEEITGRFSREEFIPLLKDADAVLFDHAPFDKALIDAAGKRLKVIGRHGVGCDAVDCEYAGAKGIAVINTPNAVTEPTAELSIALMLDAARNVSRLDRKLRQERRCEGPASFVTGSSTVFGKTLGIIGLGRIGTAVARKARGLGMNTLYTKRTRAGAAVETELNARYVDLEELLQKSDFVSLHCPYTPENHHIINEKTLSFMKKSAFLINAARGKLIDEAALAQALKNKSICGAALDVYEFEPDISAELFALDNVVMTPHIGTWNYDARLDMLKEALEGVCAYLNGGQPPNIFNKQYLRV